jgi:hypothetical protein
MPASALTYARWTARLGDRRSAAGHAAGGQNIVGYPPGLDFIAAFSVRSTPAVSLPAYCPGYERSTASLIAADAGAPWYSALPTVAK